MPSSLPSLFRVGKLAILNESGYSIHCTEHYEYWNWVDKRNEDRYENTLSHGKKYDAKNMMHTFRLLNMAVEIARFGEARVKREDRAFLLKVRAGEFDYEYLVSLAEEKIDYMTTAYKKTDLPDLPDKALLNEFLVDFRSELYHA